MSCQTMCPSIQCQHFVLLKFWSWSATDTIWLVSLSSTCTLIGCSAIFCPCSTVVFVPPLHFPELCVFYLYLFISPHAESEVCKLETLLQNEVSVVTTGDAVGADAAKTPPALRRRKRACSRRQGEKEKERDGGGMGAGDRGDRGVGEERDRREASKSDGIQLKYFMLEF